MKAVMVFCEGRHDIVFTQRSLGVLGNCKWVDKPLKKLPSPFGDGMATKSWPTERTKQTASWI